MMVGQKRRLARRLWRWCAPAVWGLAIGVVALLVYWPGLIGPVVGLDAHRAFKPLQTVDLRIGDALHAHLGQELAPVRKIVVVGLTTDSLTTWSRNRYADLIRTLKAGGASVIAFNVFFPAAMPKDDAELIRAIREAKGRVVLPQCGVVPESASDVSMHAGRESGTELDPHIEQLTADTTGIFRTQLRDAADSIYRHAGATGHVNIFYDEDLVARRVPAAIGEPGDAQFYLPLGVAAAFADGPRPASIKVERGALWCDGLRVPLDANGCILINFRPFDKMVDTRSCELREREAQVNRKLTRPETQKPITFYSYADIAAGRAPAEALQDAIVLIGHCMWGSREDLHLTPQGSQYGVLVQAMLLHTVLTRDFLEPVRPCWTVLAMLLLSIGVGAACFGLRFRGSTHVVVICGCMAMALGVGLILLAVGWWRREGFVLDATPFLLVLGLNLVVGMASNAARMTREAERRNHEMDLLLGAGKRHMSELSHEEITPAGVSIPGSRQMAFSASYSARSPEIVAETFAQTIPCDGAALFLIGQGQSLTFERGVFHGLADPRLRSEVETVAVRYAWATLQRGRPLVLSPQDSGWIGASAPSLLRSLLGIPVIARGEPLAVVLLFNKRPTSASPEKEFTDDDLRLVAALRYQSAALLENARRYQLEYEMFDGFARSLAKAVDFRDRYTRGHSERVAELSTGIAQELSLTSEEIEVVQRAATLHDLGKIGVNDTVLRKPGRLSQEEFAQIRVHAANGFEILKAAPSFEPLLPGIRHHHERYDGNGYPDGLLGNSIPLLARIIAAADAYDAMTSDRTYRRALPESKAREELLDGAGTQFDPQIVEALIRYLDKRVGKSVRASETQILSPATPPPFVPATTAHADQRTAQKK